MTRVDRMEQLLDALRQQLLERAESQGISRPADAGTEAGRSEAQRGVGMEELRRRISQELRVLDLSTAGGRKKARMSFLEAVLSWELGSGVVRDPQFTAFVQNIEETIGADSKVSGQLDGLLTALSNESQPA